MIYYAVNMQQKKVVDGDSKLFIFRETVHKQPERPIEGAKMGYDGRFHGSLFCNVPIGPIFSLFIIQCLFFFSFSHLPNGSFCAS